MTLHYRQEDETELLIKIISFGPLVKVVEEGVLPRSEKKTKRVIDERYE